MNLKKKIITVTLVSILSSMPVLQSVYAAGDMQAALIALGFGGAGSIYVYATEKHNGYQNKVRSADHYYNMIML